LVQGKWLPPELRPHFNSFVDDPVDSSMRTRQNSTVTVHSKLPQVSKTSLCWAGFGECEEAILFVVLLCESDYFANNDLRIVFVEADENRFNFGKQLFLQVVGEVWARKELDPVRIDRMFLWHNQSICQDGILGSIKCQMLYFQAKIGPHVMMPAIRDCIQFGYHTIITLKDNIPYCTLGGDSGKNMWFKSLNVSLRSDHDSVTLVEIPVASLNLDDYEEYMAKKQMTDLKDDLDDLLIKTADSKFVYSKEARWHECKVPLVAQRSAREITEETWKSAVDGIIKGYGLDAVVKASKLVDTSSWRKADAALAFFFVQDSQDMIAKRFKFTY